MGSDGLRLPHDRVRTITCMLWRSRNEAATGWSSRYTHRQSRWWDWVDGLCEPVARTDQAADAETTEPDAT
jgi:hypothetical protein